MADKLRTDYDTLSSLSSQLTSAREELQSKWTAVENAVATLVPGGSWSGPSAGVFVQWWMNAMPVPNKMFTTLSQFPEDVSKIMQMIQQLDGEMAQTFSSLAG